MAGAVGENASRTDVPAVVLAYKPAAAKRTPKRRVIAHGAGALAVARQA
jgi:hypothetical protein